jgi:hypothetical protein
MPVRKFRSVEEMLPPWMEFPPTAEDLARRIRNLWGRSHLLADRQFPKGVRKYRSLEEADMDRAMMIEADMIRRGLIPPRER